MKNDLLHKEFRWNGKQFDGAEDLLQYARAEHPDAASFLSDWFSDEGKIEVLTSGSTGSPKVIQLECDQMVHSARATGAFFGLEVGTKALHCLPVRYIAGKMMLIRAMVLGWQLYSVEPSSKLDLPKEIVFDFAAMVPLQAFHNLDQLGRIQKLLLGGGELPEELESSLYNLPSEVYMGYGMTETITHVAVRPVNPAAGAKGKDAYVALPGVTLSIDARGCLVVDAPGISKIPVQTNDLVHLVSENEFHWLGRFDNMINSGGIKLIPEEIEKQLKPFISHRFFVTSEKHDTLGEVPVLVIEGPHYPELFADILHARVSGKTELPAYAIPKKVYYSKKFKETETGKVQRASTLESLRH